MSFFWNIWKKIKKIIFIFFGTIFLFEGIFFVPVFSLGAETLPPPIITKIIPLEGAPGTRLFIYGKNFGSDCHAHGISLNCNMIISFGEKEMNWITATPSFRKLWSDEFIEIEIPDGAQSGNIQISRSEIFDWDTDHPRSDSYKITGPMFKVLPRVDESEKMIANLVYLAKLVLQDFHDVILALLHVSVDATLEDEINKKYVISLEKDIPELSQAQRNFVRRFIAYGVDINTQYLGIGERAAVIASFKAAFGVFPEDGFDIVDIFKIANGRWPSQRSGKAEEDAVNRFVKIYIRLPNENNPHDMNAIMIMAYGLRQKVQNRSLKTEGKALFIYRDIFKSLPQSTTDWNALQAIAYSGAKR